VYPILFKLTDSIRIYSFGTFVVLAFIVASWYASRRARRTLEIDGERVFNLSFAVLFVGLAGARLLWCIVHTQKIAGEPLVLFKIWEGGLVFYGGVLAGLLFLSWYLPRKPDLKGWALMDVYALATCLALFVGRWASFLAGMDYGDEAPGLPWAVRFPAVDGSQIPPRLVGVDLHPVQIYESLFGLLLFLALLFVARRRLHPGRLFGLFLILLSVGRAVIEVWRGDDAERGMVIGGHVSTSQLISLPLFFVGVAIFLSRRAPEDA